MSVTICWRPLSDKGKSFSGGTSTDLDILKRVFGETIMQQDVGQLRALQIARSSDFYNEIIDIVEKAGDIRFWGEW